VTRRFQNTLSALLGDTNDPATPALTATTTKQKASDLSKLIGQFGTGVQTIASSLEALGLARQSGREIFTASEDLFKVPTQLVQAYQKEAGQLVYYLAAAILSAVLALACLVLLGKLFLDDARRRAAQSEDQNRRNQEAILRLLDEMAKVADGDLTAHAQVTEEITGAIADSVNYTIEELRRLVSGITQASAQVTTATSEARLVTSQLLQATEKQSSEIRGTGQSVLTMAASINEVSAHAAQSAGVAQGSLSAAEKGAQAVQNAIRGMNDIRDQIQETSKRIKRLGESSQEIGEIVQLITDITEQTNVLALNAAIQAASAGEAGRGFTVVAEEVQRLAERSGEATKHISTIVKSIQSDTQDAVQAMERSTQGVVGGARVADEAGQALHDIERISKELAGLIDSISASARQQADAATRVAASMKDILGITELTTDGTKKTASSMVQLNTLANELKSSVAGFKLN
jgi:twitching motility protein PilJ